MIIAKGKTQIYFFAEAFSTIISLIFILLLIGKLGIMGLAIYRGSIIVLWQVITQFILKKMDLNFKIDNSYKVGLLISLSAMITYLIFPVMNLWINILIFGVFLAVFFYFSRYSKEELYALLNVIK